ncbi:proteoglycan 4 [Drosophila guanche]|uniref:Blast:Proteoglycan 4 n=1 Tax=Drosophila guanche TaxID=7266 RepID=A0A3B0JWW1_DROGU|nr:proteoglycan 4 [Drosophila guanche]SPP77211.1 blast:Proteoglycan 4 [Drosophila guanche]
MGCAGSTPMVATAGSEMLKAATHVREKGEAVVEDASQTLSSGLDTAKETVGAAVAGITNDLGNAFKDGTHALDEAKHRVLEGLHLEQPAAQEEEQAPESVEVMAELSSSRAPTPTPQLQAVDTDSLKTSTPEPEIERALANDEESPPTPQPSLQELAHLSEVVEAITEAHPATEAAAMPAPPAIEAAAAPASVTPAPVEGRWFRRRVSRQEPEPPRPNTTEWEKFADHLAKNKRYRPYESFAHNQNHFSVYKDHTSLRDKPGHTDGHFSGGNSLSSTSQSDLSSGHVTPAMSRKGQREFAKFVASEGPTSVSRASSRISNAGSSRTFDFNPTRDRISVFEAMSGSRSRSRSRVGSAIQRAPAERISLWGKHAAVAEEEPPPTGLGRRMSTGMSSQSVLRAPTEYNNPYSIRRAVRPVSQTRSNRMEKQTSSVTPRKVQAAKRIPTSDPLHREENTPRRSQEETAAQIPLPLEEPLEKPQRSLRTLQIPTPLEEIATDLSPSPTEDDSSIQTLPMHQGKPAPPQTQNTEAAATPKMQSSTSNWKSPLTPKVRTTSTRRNQSPTNEGMITPSTSKMDCPSTSRMETPSTTRTLSPGSPRMESPTNPRRQSPSSTPRKNASSTPKSPSPATARLPSPSPSRASTAKSSDSSLDVVIRPMSKLNTPSTKSLTPDQVVMTEYEDDALEAALANLQLLRGSTITLNSLRSCSPTASLLSSRRTSPWVMRKDYGQSKGKENKPSTAVPASAPKATHLMQTHERCDICSNEFVLH